MTDAFPKTGKYSRRFREKINKPLRIYVFKYFGFRTISKCRMEINWFFEIKGIPKARLKILGRGKVFPGFNVANIVPKAGFFKLLLQFFH